VCYGIHPGAAGGDGGAAQDNSRVKSISGHRPQ